MPNDLVDRSCIASTVTTGPVWCCSFAVNAHDIFDRATADWTREVLPIDLTYSVGETHVDVLLKKF